MANTWTIANDASKALDLPQGRVCANFGFLFQVDISADDILEAAQYLIDNKWNGVAATQAKIAIEAQKMGGLQSYAPLTMF